VKVSSITLDVMLGRALGVFLLTKNSETTPEHVFENAAFSSICYMQHLSLSALQLHPRLLWLKIFWFVFNFFFCVWKGAEWGRTNHINIVIKYSPFWLAENHGNYSIWMAGNKAPVWIQDSTFNIRLCIVGILANWLHLVICFAYMFDSIVVRLYIQKYNALCSYPTNRLNDIAFLVRPSISTWFCL